MVTLLYIVIVLVLVFANGFFVASEFALVGVRRSRIQLHIADFGKGHNPLMRAASFPWQLFDGFKTTSDNVNGLLPNLIQDAGFVEVHKSADYMTLFGTISLFAARKV